MHKVYCDYSEKRKRNMQKINYDIVENRMRTVQKQKVNCDIAGLK